MSTVSPALDIDLRTRVGQVVEILPIRRVQDIESRYGPVSGLLIRLREEQPYGPPTDTRGMVYGRWIINALTPDIGEGDWVRARVTNPDPSYPSRLALEPAE